MKAVDLIDDMSENMYHEVKGMDNATEEEVIDAIKRRLQRLYKLIVNEELED